jgi:hypothetical protein
MMLRKEVIMSKKMSPKELLDRMKSLRKKPMSTGFVDKHNKITEEDDRRERSPGNKKIARIPEVES